MERMLITGGVGFIGVNAARYFCEKGWEVTAFDNFSRRGVDRNAAFLRKTFGNRIAIVEGDVRSRRDLSRVVRDQDVILHLAAQAAVTTSVAEPWGDFKTNTQGTMRVLEAARLSPKKPIVLYASTNKVYGALEGIPINEEEQRYAFSGSRRGIGEEQQLDFHSPYGCSKGAADQYVRDYARLYGLRTVVFRQSCIYGPHQYGVEDQGWVAWFLIAGLLGKPITIYGNGKQIRDLLFIHDLLCAYECAIAHIDRAKGKIYNIGGGTTNTLSLLELLTLMEREFSLHTSPTFAPLRPGDQLMFVSDNGRIAADLGWKPSSSLLDGIRTLFQWLEERRGTLEEFYRQQSRIFPRSSHTHRSIWNRLTRYARSLAHSAYHDEVHSS